MKKLVTLLVLAGIGAFGIGRFNLGEAGGMRFLMKMESLMSEGKADEVCEMFHDDLVVDIADHSGESTETVQGGKAELCNLTRTTLAGLQLLPHSMNVEYTDVESKYKFSKPWSGELTYSEHRTLNIPGVNVSMQTVSDDQITLVQTFSGVKLLRVKSEVFKVEST